MVSGNVLSSRFFISETGSNDDDDFELLGLKSMFVIDLVEV